MSDEDFSVGGGANGNHSPNLVRQSGKHRGPRFSWNLSYEATFFRSLCDSVRLGLREGSTFKVEAWDRATQALIEYHNAYANKGHLINKSDNARKKFRLWRGLREDPEFIYNPQNKTVSASEDAWKRHIEREPLSRSLRGRPFEHEDFYEILFPDVIGSGGAPKRLTKPRRTDTHDGRASEEQDAPGTGIMDLLSYPNPAPPQLPPPPQQQQQPPPPPPPPVQQQPVVNIPAPAPPPLTQQHPRPNTNSLQARAASMAPGTALTPPEDNTLQPRKRFQAPDSASQPEKRRRTAAPGYLDLPQAQGSTGGPSPAAGAASSAGTGTSTGMGTATGVGTGTGTAAAAATVAGTSTASDGIQALADALRTARVRPGWSEQAMDIFFRDFSDEDMDLQLKIAEKALTDENKAMVFCKMTVALRKHWVKRLREVHNRGVA
ncbi:Myb/SANT-like DNA-binding domain-containing protein [Lasiosphaeria ovina]|uniref:Myb/SANT-like DNA-binding domain-containing protein n=1 Tax=Lasiosphaeria ovina TaxID=92902 RepID=A0AAE0NFQ3_9PEZI|nr:Myb/SANT-like DNA-binding domain-containing protein [Lasiosphaeria ovina]